MNKIRINTPVCLLYMDEDLRPSIKHKAGRVLSFNGIYMISDFCRRTKTDLLAIDDLDKTVLSLMEKNVYEGGLSLGMTQQELDDYEDSEYINLHSKEEGKKVRLTGELLNMFLNKRKQDCRNTMNQMISERGLMNLRPEDFEYMRFNFFRMYILRQPWYVRIFCNAKNRVLKAKRQSERDFDIYVKAYVEDLVEAHTRSFGDELKAKWDEKWQNYLSDIKE